MAGEPIVPPDQIIWKEFLMKKSHLWLAAAFIAGVILAPKVRQLPLLDKLPSA